MSDHLRVSQRETMGPMSLPRIDPPWSARFRTEVPENLRGNTKRRNLVVLLPLWITLLAIRGIGTPRSSLLPNMAALPVRDTSGWAHTHHPQVSGTPSNLSQVIPWLSRVSRSSHQEAPRTPYVFPTWDLIGPPLQPLGAGDLRFLILLTPQYKWNNAPQ